MTVNNNRHRSHDGHGQRGGHEQAIAGLLGPVAAAQPWSLEFADLYRLQIGADVQALLFFAFAVAFADR